MKGLCVVIVGGGAGLGALVARMAVAEGAAGPGIIDLAGAAAEAAPAPPPSPRIPRHPPRPGRPCGRCHDRFPGWGGSTRW